MLENIRLSFQGIWSHKMRSFLTMLGIIIGIAAIISIVSTIKGTNEQIKQNLVGSGNNTVDVSLYKGTIEYQIEYYGVPEGITPITDETMDEIAKIDSVESASRYVSRDYLESTVRALMELWHCAAFVRLPLYPLECQADGWLKILIMNP